MDKTSFVAVDTAALGLESTEASNSMIIGVDAYNELVNKIGGDILADVFEAPRFWISSDKTPRCTLVVKGKSGDLDATALVKRAMESKKNNGSSPAQGSLFPSA